MNSVSFVTTANKYCAVCARSGGAINGEAVATPTDPGCSHTLAGGHTSDACSHVLHGMRFCGVRCPCNFLYGSTLLQTERAGKVRQTHSNRSVAKEKLRCSKVNFQIGSKYINEILTAAAIVCHARSEGKSCEDPKAPSELAAAASAAASTLALHACRDVLEQQVAKADPKHKISASDRIVARKICRSQCRWG